MPVGGRMKLRDVGALASVKSRRTSENRTPLVRDPDGALSGADEGGGRTSAALQPRRSAPAGGGDDAAVDDAGGGAMDAAGADAVANDAAVADASVDAALSADATVVMVDAAQGDGPNADAAFAFSESFSVASGSEWPDPWDVLGGVASQTVESGQGRLVPTPSNYSLARMGFDAGVRDVEVSVRVTFEDVGTQGVGFYVRQNGGWLQGTTPHGSGYAVFLEGFRGSRIGVWHEINGVEQEIAFDDDIATLASFTQYRVRFRVTQEGAETRLRARVWLVGTIEPTTWQVDATDDEPSLQNVAGGFAVDSWSTRIEAPLTAGTLVDDIVIVGL